MVKQTRLDALADAPYAYAYGSARALERDFAAEVWHRRVGAGDWFLARAQEQVVGLAAAITEEAHPRQRRLVAMWVHPDYRGSSAATAIVRAVCLWALAGGADSVSLWVADGNTRARRFYERARRPVHR